MIDPSDPPSVWCPTRDSAVARLRACGVSDRAYIIPASDADNRWLKQLTEEFRRLRHDTFPR